MSRSSFEKIIGSLNYTISDPMAYKDRLWEVREMLEECDDNIQYDFLAILISCLYESMSKCMNKWTLLGFMVVSINP